jgi:hypothetical protein
MRALVYALDKLRLFDTYQLRTKFALSGLQPRKSQVTGGSALSCAIACVVKASYAASLGLRTAARVAETAAQHARSRRRAAAAGGELRICESSSPWMSVARRFAWLLTFDLTIPDDEILQYAAMLTSVI